MGQANEKSNGTNEEVVSCTVLEDPDELQDEEMREVDIEGSKILLVKTDGKIYAVGAKCPCDANEALSEGVVHNGRIRCGQHGSVYSLETGDLIEYPGLDCIHSFHVELQDGHVEVQANRQHLKEDRRVKRAARLFPSDKRTMLIVGAGAAGLSCAETLRQEGFVGKIVVVTKGKHLPFDQPNKVPAAQFYDTFPLRDRKYYTSHDILFKTEKEIARVNTEKNRVHFKDGDEISYYKLLIATGSRPRVVTMIPGYDLQNITTLRTLHDLHLVTYLGENVVILGASFLGMQLAAKLIDEAKSVTVIDSSHSPLQNIFGMEVGNCLKTSLEKHGVKFHMESTVKEFEGETGRLKRVVLKDGTTLEASLCIAAIGVEPVTGFLKDSGIVISDTHHLIVNKHMKTNKKDVYAAGEITEFPLMSSDDALVNIQHWQMAQQQGRIAALNMLDKDIDVDSVPYFWLTIGEHTIRFAGHNAGFEKTVISGDLENSSLVAYYIKDGRVVGVASLNRDPVVSQAAELFHAKESIALDDPIALDDLLSDTPAWIKRFRGNKVDDKNGVIVKCNGVHEKDESNGNHDMTNGDSTEMDGFNHRLSTYL